MREIRTKAVLAVKEGLRFFKAQILLLYDLVRFVQKGRYTIHIPLAKERKAYVLGNGPSLAEFLQSEVSVKDADLFVCNGFALTGYFEQLRPANYFLHDPLFFDLQHEKVTSRGVPVLDIWEALFEKTKWPLTLYTSLNDPSGFLSVKERYPDNPFISFVNLNPVKFLGKNRYDYYAKGLGLIGGMTVVHLSLQIAILSRYKEVYLVGVDHDWCQNIKYDEQNHKVYLLNKHFFDEVKLYYGEGILSHIDLAVEFDSFARSLSGFKELAAFGRQLNVEIFRASRSFLHFIPYKRD